MKGESVEQPASAEAFLNKYERQVKDGFSDPSLSSDEGGNEILQQLRRLEDMAGRVAIEVGSRIEHYSDQFSPEQVKKLEQIFEGSKKLQTRALEKFMDLAAKRFGLPSIE